MLRIWISYKWCDFERESESFFRSTIELNRETLEIDGAK